MLRVTLNLLFVGCLSIASLAAQPANQPANAAHYLFVWAGDAAGQQTDFLAVIDASPSSPRYGQLLTTLATDQQTKLVHHTEYTMPAGGILFANDHEAGRTFLFDLRDPLHPRIAGSFTDIDGYMHPHSYLRLPDQNILSTFQHGHDGGRRTRSRWQIPAQRPRSRPPRTPASSTVPTVSWCCRRSIARSPPTPP
jgi:hypothetical protein